MADGGTGGPSPVVSVVLPTRNRPDSLQRAVASVLGQTRRDWELVVVDDASDERTRSLLPAVVTGDPRIRLLHHEARRGGGAARNTGIEAARGPWVAFLDDDAEWRPDKLALQLDRVATAEGATLAYGPVLAVDESGEASVVGGPVPERNAFEVLARGNRIDTSGVMVDRATLLGVGGFDPALPRLQDWDLWLRLVPGARLVYAESPLARTYRVGRRISTDPPALRLAAERLAEKHASSAALLATLGHMLLAEGESEPGRALLDRAWSLEPGPGLGLRRLLARLSPTAYRALSLASARRRPAAAAGDWPGGSDE